MGDGDYRIGAVDVTVADGAVRNKDGALAGSVSTMDHGLRVLLEICGARLQDGLSAATLNPSEAIQRWDLGRIRPGTRGDLTLLDGLEIAGTVVGGRVAYLTDESRWKGRPHAVAR
jgi:N-acetylglucosamine-6-phosphate deacetylase